MDSSESDPEVPDLDKLLPEGVDAEEFWANVTRMAMQFMKEQGNQPLQYQLMILGGFLLVPFSLLLYCACKLMNNRRKWQTKDKRKQKDTKKEPKKKV